MQPIGKPLTAAGIRIAKARMSQDGLYAFQCRASKLPEPEAQYRFALPLGKGHRADFAFIDYRLLVEIDGGIWTRGAHGHPIDIIRNMKKQNDAVLLGWFTLRFSTDEVKNGLAVQFTEKVLAARGWEGA